MALWLLDALLAAPALGANARGLETFGVSLNPT